MSDTKPDAEATREELIEQLIRGEKAREALEALGELDDLDLDILKRATQSAEIAGDLGLAGRLKDAWAQRLRTPGLNV